MTHQIQTLSALLIVAAAAIWLGLRAAAKRRKPGCGSDCGCDSGTLRAKALRRDRTG